MKFIWVLSLTFWAFSADAKILQKALEKYSKASSIQFGIKKTDEKIILGSKSQASGILRYQKGRIYILLNSDKKVELFYSDKMLTLVEHPDSDFDKDGKRKVTLLKKSTPPLIISLLNLFSNPKNFSKEFSLKKETVNDGLAEISLDSKQKNIKDLNLKINAKDLKLAELSFVDDVETKTTLEFDNLKLNSKMTKDEFTYKPQPTDEVMTE